MKRNLSTIICCLAVIAAAVAPVQVAVAAEARQPAAAPTVSVNTPSSAKSAKESHVTSAGLRKQIEQLERDEHMLELFAGTDRTSHSAIAAQHIRVAINELKLEAKKSAHSKQAGQETRSAGAATPGVRR
jgi:hypothetical protein